MTPEIRTQTRTADGLEIRYAEANADGGPLLLLLSPWPESIYCWEQLWPRLSAVAHVVAIDLPGFGHSEGRTELYSTPGMGGFLLRLIDEWELAQPHIIGPDVGCPSTLYAAATSPSSLTSAVVGNAATAYPLQVAGPLKDLIEAPDFDALLALDGAERVREAMGLHERYDVSPAALEDYMTGYAGSRFGESTRFVRNYPDDLPVLAELLPQIQAPVNVVYGARDPMVPPGNADYLGEHLPHAKLTALDFGHYAWEDGADQYGDAILEWIDGGFRRLGGDQ